MTKEQQIQFIRTWCIEANPEHYGDAANNIQWKLPIVRLADVLLAIQAKKFDYAFMVDQEGGFVTAMQGQPPTIYSVFKGWNLREDNLEQQSDECLQFLWNLLK